MKGDITKVLVLDPVMATECSKTIKAVDRSLLRVQNFVLDAMASLSTLLDALNADEVGISCGASAANSASSTRARRFLSHSLFLGGLIVVQRHFQVDLVLFPLLWPSGPKILLGESFPKMDHLQQSKLLQKAKEK